MARLGTVGANGATYFTHEDINECREFLLDAGFEHSINGWLHPDGKRFASIRFDYTVWYACIHS